MNTSNASLDEIGTGRSRAAKKRQKKKSQQKRQHDQAQTQKIVKDDKSVSNNIHSVVKKPKLDNELHVNLKKDEILIDGTPSDILFGNDKGEELPAPDRARSVLQSILGPNISARTFYREYWEKKPLHVKRSDVLEIESALKYFDGFLSKKDIENMIKNQGMKYGVDLNVTKCTQNPSKDIVRHTLDPVPDSMQIDDAIVAKPNDVWTNFEDGCSVRLLCPQLHSEKVHALLSIMESEFGCMVGANAYLTPGKVSQGFAPHYDDIEAFILQLEGKKHWKVYNPISLSNTLPRESSKDLDIKKLPDSALDIVLEPGDLLYMPRGWIHQAVTTRDNTASIHLTISAMQHWSWADFLEIVMPDALQSAIESDSSTSLREGLPRNFLSYMGTMFDTNDEYDQMMRAQQSTPKEKDKKKEKGIVLLQHAEDLEQMNEKDLEEIKRKEIKRLQDMFREKAKGKIMKVCKEAFSMVDAACDEIGKRYLSDRLPPALSDSELAGTSENRKQNGGIITGSTLCRIAREGIARLVIEGDDKAILYHCADNSLRFHENPLSPMEFELDDAPALEMIITTIEPDWVQVRDLIHDDIEDRIGVAQTLFDEGILIINNNT